MARIMMEFDSPEELAGFVSGKAAGVAVAMPVVLVNAHPQTITLAGTVTQHDGAEALVITIGGRADESRPNTTSLAPGEQTVVARP